MILSVQESASLDGNNIDGKRLTILEGALATRTPTATAESCHSNRKFLLECGISACLPCSGNRVYSLLGRLLAFDSILYIGRVLLPNRTVLPCLTAATAYWPLPPTLSNTWRRFFDGWPLIMALICTLHIVVFAAPKPPTTQSLEQR